MAKKLIQVVYQVNDAALLKAAGSLKANEDAARKADDQVKKYGKDAEAAGNQAGKSFMNLGNIWKGLIAIGIVTFVGNLAKKTFELGVKQEQLNIAFTTFLGSATAAKKLLAELNKFAVITPFTPDQVNAAAKALLAFGVAGNKIIPTLKIIGDVSAATGKDLAEMAVIFGQIQSTGRLMGQDLLQLVNAGFNPLQQIFLTTGRSVTKLKEDMEKGLITFDMVEKAFIDATSAGGRFFNLMEEQSKTIGGVLSTVSGNIDDILKNIFSASSGPVKVFVDDLLKLSSAFLRLSQTTEQADDRIRLDLMAKTVEELKAYALQVGNVDEAARLLTAALAENVKVLQDENDAIHAGKPAKDGVYTDNLKQIDAIKIRSQAITEYIDELKKGEEALALKKTTAEIEKQAEALKRLNKLKGLFGEEKPLPGMDDGGGRLADPFEVAHGIAKEGETVLTDDEKAQRGILGFLLDEAEPTFDAWLETLKSQQQREQEARDLAAINEIATEKNKQDKIKELKMQAFDFGVDLLGQAIFASMDADQREVESKIQREKQLAGLTGEERARKEAELLRDDKARKDQAKREQAVTIKKILIESALNAVKALGLPPIPGANWVAAGLSLIQGVAMAGIVKSQGFKEGVIGLEGPGTGLSDSIPARLSAGESVITAEATGNSRNLLEAINDHRIDDRVLKGLKVTAGGVTVINDNKGVEKAIRDKQEPDYYEQGHFVNKIIKKSDTLRLHIRAKSF